MKLYLRALEQRGKHGRCGSREDMAANALERGNDMAHLTEFKPGGFRPRRCLYRPIALDLRALDQADFLQFALQCADTV